MYEVFIYQEVVDVIELWVNVVGNLCYFCYFFYYYCVMYCIVSIFFSGEWFVLIYYNFWCMQWFGVVQCFDNYFVGVQFIFVLYFFFV